MLALSIRVSAFFGLMAPLAHAQCATNWWQVPPIGGTTDSPISGIITRLAVLGSGDVIASGPPAFAGAPFFVGRLTNGVWSTLGVGTDAFVHALLPMPNGDVIAGGEFTTAGGVAANSIARWNGTAWSPLGLGLNAQVYALARMPNGDIVATGSFSSAGGVFAHGIARWNGTTWSPLGSGLGGFLGGIGQGLGVMPNGDLVVTGGFTTAGGVPANNVARWNGTAWSAMGAGVGSGSTSVTFTPNGDVVVAGPVLGSPSPVQRWDGASWQPVVPPGSLVMSLIALPDGDLLAATFFWGGWFRVTRLHGTTWTDVGVVNGLVHTLARAAGGDVFAGGTFTDIDGKLLPNIARFATSCPALAVTSGAGCPSSGGANTLVATSLPWLGGTFATAGSGLPANALVAVVRGFAPANLPLVSVLPQGQPGCALRVAPDLLDVVAPVNGTATASLPLPAVPSLVGLTFGEQWVPLELGPSLAIVAMTSTNSLRMTIGVF